MVKFCVIGCKSAEGLKRAEATPRLVWKWQVSGQIFQIGFEVKGGL